MQKKEIKVSIIVPIYNSELYLENCLESLINQTYKNIEIILVDDGSNDNSKIICTKYISSKVKYFYKKNGGVSSARNVGIEESTTNYIIFVDSDDTIELDAISKLVANIKDDKTLVGLKRKINNVSIFADNKNKASLLNAKNYITDIIYSKVSGFCTGYLFNKKYIKKFDEKSFYMEDTLFLITYLKKINNITLIDSFYNYLENDNSITRGVSIEKVTKNIININYTLNEINKLLENYNIIKDNDEIILEKKAKVIESESAKINNAKELCKLIDNNEIKKIINELSVRTKNKRNKLFYNLWSKKNKPMLSIYIFARRKVKKILGSVK